MCKILEFKTLLLNKMNYIQYGFIGYQCNMGQIEALNFQKDKLIIVIVMGKRENNVPNGPTFNGQHRQSEFYVDITHMDFWYWIINQGASRHAVCIEFFV